MFFRRVLLVFPRYEKSYFGALRPPTGIGYLAESLKKHHINYEVLDMSLGYGKGKLIRTIDDFRPDLLAVSMMSFRYKSHYDLVREVKQRFPNIVIAAGGPHISTFREQALTDCQELDFGFVLEGEQSLIELCKDKDPRSIKGLIYRDDEKPVYNGDRPFRRDLDKIAFPTYDGFELEKYMTDDIEIVTSRGCPQSCIFCPVKTAIGQQYRARSAANVADEIEYWYKQGRRHFGIADDNFTLLKERVYKLCDEIERRGLTGLEFRCGNGIRADKVDYALLRRMHEVGFKYLSFGVESGNNKILKNIKKGEDIETIKEAIKAACTLDYEVTLFFLVGSPGETWADLEDSIRIARTNPVFDAKFYNLIPYPATELLDWVKSRKLFLVEPSVCLDRISSWDNQPVFETPDMRWDERIRALKYTKKIRKQVRRNAITRRLSRFGFFANPLANLFVLEAFQNLLMHNRMLRRFATSAYEKVRS